MRKYCKRLESGDKADKLVWYQKSLIEIKKWYLQQYQHYHTMLQHEMAEQIGNEILIENRSVLVIDNYTDNFGAKLTLFNVADFLCKQILSVYTYGPELSMPINFNSLEIGTSWISNERNVFDISELAEMQLYDHNEGSRINFSVLAEDRSIRSNLTHGGEIAACLSAIRCYNVLRDMIVFMDEESASELPRFEYPRAVACNMQQFLSHANNLNFENENTILVIGSVHDITAEGKELLANLPWNLVIDFDGYSAFGGLRGAVNHKHIIDQRLSLPVANSFSVADGYTTWLTCGDFCEPTYTNMTGRKPYQKDFFKSKMPFCSDYHQYQSNLITIIEKIISKFSQRLGPLTIVYLYHEKNIARAFLDNCEKHYVDIPYSFNGIYYLPESSINDLENSIYANYKFHGETYEDRFAFVSCDLDSFIVGMLEYRKQFSLRTDNTSTTSLPSEEGFYELSNNLVVNLSEYFEVLYRGTGNEPPEEVTKLVSEFYHGGIAPWCAFQNGIIHKLIRDSEYNQELDKIRNCLKRIPDKASNKIINLIHKPGIGGSTLMRHFGWDLHEEYPVLIIKKYVNEKVKELIWQLYDELKRGILILADTSIDDIDRLKQDICTIPRACVLIISSREGHVNVGSAENRLRFSSITDESEGSLRQQFKKYSTLTPEEKAEKDRLFEQFVQQDRASMRCPFMIGLYYQEKNFFGVSDYVAKIVESVSERTELQVLSIIALCDYYGQIGFPKVLIDSYVGISARSSYLLKHPYASGAFILGYHPSGVQIYRSKHYIISRNLLELCSEKLYNSSFAGSIKDLAFLLIDSLYAACERKFNNIYQEILERIFIDKSLDVQGFSQLILDIPEPLSRKAVLEHLALQFSDLAERYEPKEVPLLYRMSAHFCGHLCRLCSKKTGGVHNPIDAERYGEMAVRLMELGTPNSPDPLIYHMLGDSRFNVLRTEWENKSDEQPTVEEYDRFERALDTIRDIFDKAARWGSEDYAIVSKISMYIAYLKKLYLWKGIDEISKLSLLTINQAKYRAEIEELFNQLINIPLNERTQQIYERYEREYRSDIMMNNYGKAIEYYQNLLDSMRGRIGSDAEMQELRRSLINIRMAKCRYEAQNKALYYLEMKPSEIDEILNLIEQNIEQHIDAGKYRERNQRIVAYDRWLQLSKLKGSNRSVQQAIRIAQRWEELEKFGLQDDPRPYYYQYVLSALSVLDGNYASIEQLHRYMKLSYSKARAAGYNTETIRDLLVEGTGLSRLLDLRHVGNPVHYIENAHIMPTVFEGIFEEYDGGKGHINIKKPVAWSNEDLKFTLGTVDRSNSVGERQITHRLATFAGFSYGQLTSMNNYIRDYTANEPIPALQTRKKAENKPYRKSRNKRPSSKH